MAAASKTISRREQLDKVFTEGFDKYSRNEDKYNQHILKFGSSHAIIHMINVLRTYQKATRTSITLVNTDQLRKDLCGLLIYAGLCITIMDHSEMISDSFKVKLNEGLALFTRKNQDYGDAFADLGTPGVIVRMMDKLRRFQSITESSEMKVKSESLRDTLIDLMNYAGMAIMLLDEQSIVGEEEA